MCGKCEAVKDSLRESGVFIAETMELQDKFGAAMDELGSVEAFNAMTEDEKNELENMRRQIACNCAMIVTRVGMVGGLLEDISIAKFLRRMAEVAEEAEAMSQLFGDHDGIGIIFIGDDGDEG